MTGSRTIQKDKNLNNYELVRLHEFALILNSTRNIDEILKKSAATIREVMQSDGCHILFSEQLRDRLKLKTAIFDGGKPLPPDVDETKGISGLTFESGQMVLVADAENDPRVTKKMQEYFRHKSMVSVPIKVKGRTMGVIVVYSKIPAKYSERDGQFLMMLGAHLGLAVENANLMLQLQKAAIEDPLTGAHNYRYFRHTLEEIICGKSDEPVSLIMLDINSFKQINDKYGHLAGDFVLREVTRVLQQSVRGRDTVTRNGGDEFALILPGVDTEEAVHIMTRIEEAVANHTFLYQGHEIKVSVSWGAITTTVKNQKCINKIIALADKRLYNMKKVKKKLEQKSKIENCDEN